MHPSEKHQRTKILVSFAVLAAMLAGLFNTFSSALEQSAVPAVSLWWAAPFVLLLTSIAVVPFVNRLWWDKNYWMTSLGLGILVVGSYGLLLGGGARLLRTSYEYISFISLIGSLFVVAGGIHIHIRGKASPWENVMYLATGAVLSNLLGTTGASMVLIRPYLRTNKYRFRGYHLAFFIFLVGNIGGALTPIGDPPLFLGYLKGVPFLWVLSNVSEIWVLTVSLVLLLFFMIDYFFYRRESAKVQSVAAEIDEPQVLGIHNVFFLFIILGSVFIQKPLLLREIVMWGAALGSFYTTGEEIHHKNQFTFHPIKEVAVLFAGIFATMIPALDWLDLHAASLSIVTPGQYFWATGVLSSVLDNAPTYLSFLTASFGLHGASVDNLRHMQVMLGNVAPDSLGLPNPLHPGALAITASTWKYIQSVSVGAVFFGAMTYIGNGPNFMIKAIAEHAGVDCPSFFGYIVKYSVPILIPVFLIVWWTFFRM